MIPGRRTVERYKHLLACQLEADAGKALLNLAEDTTSTLSYDTTQRNYVNGDWVSIILKTSDHQRFDLRPIEMAFENRENIISYISEEYKRMAAAVSVLLKTATEAKQLWEKTTFISTDSVSKNHHIGAGVAEEFDSEHIPIHAFCKSHTAGEGIDSELLKVLKTSLEGPLKLREKLERVNPALRMFFRNTTIVQAGMRALTKLVTPDKNANSCSLSAEFDQLCADNDVRKKLTLYKERRFCKLGSCAGALLQALPLLTQLLDQSPANNMLAQASRVFIKCDIFITELRMLAYFGQHVTMPFLNCIELVDAVELMRLQKQMHQDLLQANYLCEYKCAQSSGLTQHKRTHSSKKLFECDICQKQFTRKANRNTHMKTHTTVNSQPGAANAPNDKPDTSSQVINLGFNTPAVISVKLEDE